MKIRWMMIVAGIMGLSVFGLSACGDDTTTGPQFGDLQFTPSFENIGNGRTIELELTNTSSVELGPILVGHSFPTNSFCTTIAVTATPSNLASLAPAADVVINIDIDTTGADPNSCPPAQYDLDISAAVDDRILEVATVRFNLDSP